MPFSKSRHALCADVYSTGRGITKDELHVRVASNGAIRANTVHDTMGHSVGRRVLVKERHRKALLNHACIDRCKTGVHKDACDHRALKVSDLDIFQTTSSRVCHVI
jgi:hypothetical protein